MTTTSISRIAAPIANIYRTNEGLFSKILDGLTESELWYQPTETNNPMLWIAGHVVHCRVLVLKLMGQSFDTTWGELFGRGAKLEDRSHYPGIEQILQTMTPVSGRLQETMQSLDDDAFLRPAAGPRFPNSETLADQIAFLAMHDSYHIGQMAYLRKALRREGPTG